MASKLKILPQPLDLVIAEIGGGDGNGGGFWFWKVFGGGGFDGWRRRRKRNRNLGFLAYANQIPVLLVGFGLKNSSIL
ncbi:hypothetical protein CFP56_021047 [Quercus suber]|uniref:Uncharacterized protein n=1 Tax=Quercus suber TaxID=58331 RepID=A0AAW0KIE0_QUESU